MTKIFLIVSSVLFGCISAVFGKVHEKGAHHFCAPSKPTTAFLLLHDECTPERAPQVVEKPVEFKVVVRKVLGQYVVSFFLCRLKSFTVHLAKVETFFVKSKQKKVAALTFFVI